MDFSTSLLNELENSTSWSEEESVLSLWNGTKGRPSADVRQPTSTGVSLGTAVSICLSSELSVSDGFILQDSTCREHKLILGD